MTFKEKFIAFIMKKWTAPIVCGVCIVLIIAMSADSFAKYYTKVQEERAASVAVYATNVALWNGEVVYNGHVKILLHTNSAAKDGTYPLPYSPGDQNTGCTFQVSNKANGRVCEVRLEYTITITFPKALPSGVTWTVLESNEAGTYNNDTTRTFTSSSYFFEAGVEKSIGHTIHFKVTSPSNPMNYPQDEYYEDVIIQITATQVTD